MLSFFSIYSLSRHFLQVTIDTRIPHGRTIGGVAAVTVNVCQTQHGYTALMRAARNGRTECVRLLLEGRADKNASDVRNTMCRFLTVCIYVSFLH